MLKHFFHSKITEMASGDPQRQPKHLTFSKSKVPVLGALIDYISTSFEYFRFKSFARAEELQVKVSKGTVSATFLALVCSLLGFVANVKFEVVTLDETPLPNDLHFMLLSKKDNLYIDDIDVSRVMWCIEASDLMVLLISCLLVWNSSNVRSPLSEYLFLPWLGATLRGLFLRQVPTAGALVYTMAVVDGDINPLFLTSFVFLFLLEARFCLEISRLLRARWDRRGHTETNDCDYEVETLWSNEDVQSVEMQNYVY